jgi:hypothetical protein
MLVGFKSTIIVYIWIILILVAVINNLLKKFKQ